MSSFGRTVYEGVRLPVWFVAPPKIRGLQPLRAPWRAHLPAEKCFLPGTRPCKKQIGFYSTGCGRRNSARPVRALIWKLSFGRFFRLDFLRTTSEAFPLGGRWPGAAETDEGATGYPTEQKKTGVQAAGGWAMAFYKERLRRNRPLISHLR